MIGIGAIEEMTLEALGGLRKVAPIVSLRYRMLARTADGYFNRRINRTEQDPRVNGGTNIIGTITRGSPLPNKCRSE
jgi:hypothetical protein